MMPEITSPTSGTSEYTSSTWKESWSALASFSNSTSLAVGGRALRNFCRRGIPAPVLLDTLKTGTTLQCDGNISKLIIEIK